MPLLLDAVGTLIHPAQPVGAVYAAHLEDVTGHRIDPAQMQLAFLATFSDLANPVYARGESGHATEEAWWQSLVAQVLHRLSADHPALRELLPNAPRRRFDAFFDQLWDHYRNPSAWMLYPDTPGFLEAASRLDRMLVVSNFDDRLRPILEGLAIAHYFEEILTSADAKARKPDPALFHRAFEALGCTPSACVHCGDSLKADLVGANSVGIFGFLLQRPHHDLNDFLSFYSLITEREPRTPPSS